MTRRAFVTETRAPAETFALAERVGRLLRAGDVVVLSGDLGAGKTLFAKGFGHALGVTDTVVSPTFTVVREYVCGSTDDPSGAATRPSRMVHVDVYRLDHVQELHDVGWDDYLDGESVAVVEWGDRVRALLPLDRLDVHLAMDDHGDDAAADRRVVTLAPFGASWAARSDALAALVEVA
jgi:tRNA threonylcarbamoyladenosine biosynthesis protein TsaE